MTPAPTKEPTKKAKQPAQKRPTKKSQHHGLSGNQEAILLALSDGRLHTYRDIVLATGLYSNLPAELRYRHAGSLGDKGLVRESSFVVPAEAKSKREEVWTFQISSTGCGQLGKPVPSFVSHVTAAKNDFQERYLRFLQEHRQVRVKAKQLGLQGNAYLILRALADGSEKTFADIARATGVFSGLPQYLRKRHADHKSLASLGLVCESQSFEEDKAVFTFQITKAGQKLLARVEKND